MTEHELTFKFPQITWFFYRPILLIRPHVFPAPATHTNSNEKSCLIRILEQRLTESNENAFMLAEFGSAAFEPSAFMKELGRKWGIEIDAHDPMEMLSTLDSELEEGKNYIIIVDEVTDLFEGLDDSSKTKTAILLRSLINLRHPSGEHKCSMILSGLKGTLNRLGEISETLRQRLEMERIVLGPLTIKQAKQYIRNYLSEAGMSTRSLNKKLVKSGIDEIWERSQGIPRTINNILHQMLDQMPERGKLPSINRKFVKESVSGMEETGRPEFEKLSTHKKRVVKGVAKHEPRGITVPSLAEELKDQGIPTSRASVSTTCKQLSKKGWVLRSKEGKTHRIRISSFAKTILAKI